MIAPNRKGDLQAVRHRHAAQLYFDIAAATEATSVADLKNILEATREPLLNTMLRENPVVVEDHSVRVLVTEDHMRMYNAAYPFFGKLCGATEKEIQDGMRVERADTIKNFGKTEPYRRSFFAVTAAQITSQMEAWEIASEERKTDLRVTASAKYKAGGFWNFIAELNQFSKTVFNDQLIEPKNRLAEFPDFYLVTVEVEWAVQLMEIAAGESVSEKERSAIQQRMLEDFKTFKTGKELTAIANARDNYFNAETFSQRTHQRLAILSSLKRSTPQPDSLQNYLFQIPDQSANEERVETGEANPTVLTSWHIDSFSKWMTMIAWLADQPLPNTTELEANLAHVKKLYQQDKDSRYFLNTFPLFVDEALSAWMTIPQTKRTEIKNESKALFSKHKNLANAAYPLSKLSIATRKKRLKLGLDAVESKLVQMQIENMQFQMMMQSNAIVLNALSEAGAITAAGPDADIFGGGGSGLMIDGDIHQYPVPQSFMVGQYASMASMSSQFKTLMESEIKKANQQLEYLESIRPIVAGGALDGIVASAVPPLLESSNPIENAANEKMKAKPQLAADPDRAPPMNESKQLEPARKDAFDAQAQAANRAEAKVVQTIPKSAQQSEATLALPLGYKTWKQNKLTHPDGIEFIDSQNETPSRVLEFEVTALENASSTKLPKWGADVATKLEYALSIAAIDVIEDGLFDDGVLTGEGMTEHGEFKFKIRFKDGERQIQVLLVPLE